MLAILSATATIAGLVLVFSGFLFAVISSLPPETADRHLARFAVPAKLAVIPFVLALITASTSYAWLITCNALAYTASVILFWVVLALTAAYGAFVLLIRL
jgi:hypothetical protein